MRTQCVQLVRVSHIPSFRFVSCTLASLLMVLCISTISSSLFSPCTLQLRGLGFVFDRMAAAQLVTVPNCEIRVASFNLQVRAVLP